MQVIQKDKKNLIISLSVEEWNEIRHYSCNKIEAFMKKTLRENYGWNYGAWEFGLEGRTPEKRAVFRRLTTKETEEMLSA